MGENTVIVNGLRIRYFDAGEGPVVLLVHGGTLGFSSETWVPVIGSLVESGFRAVTYDQPGFGKSEAPEDFSLKYRQKFVIDVLDALNISDAFLVGHSQGGVLVIRAALEEKDRTKGVVVLATGSLLPPIDREHVVGAVRPDEPTLHDTFELLKGNVYHADLLTDEFVRDYHRYSVGMNFGNALRRQDMAKEDNAASGVPLWKRLDEVEVPSLFIYGANDRGKAAERVLLARQRYPKLQFELLDRCSHLVQIDCPDQVVKLLTEFLSERPYT